MARYVGVKNNHIVIASNEYFNNSNLEIIELPIELQNVSNIDLISNFRYKDKEFKSKTIYQSSNNLKVAFVSNWKMQCGISTYLENLAPEIAKHIKEFKLFIEENEFPTGDIYQFGDQVLNKDQISISWKRDQSLLNLANEIKKYDPDIVLINHEWGIFPNAKAWLSLMTQLSEYKVIVIMHSVFPSHKDKLLVEASLSNIIVHLDGAKQALYDKGINANIAVIPHGCSPPFNKQKPWNFYKTNHNILQQGFAFKYKGFESSIQAISLLKNKYPDIFFTGLLSVSPQNLHNHQVYYNELLDLVNSLNIKDNISLILKFQTNEVIETFLQLNNIVLLPYKSEIGHKVFGASGQVRVAFSAGIPVISSSIPHFSDVPSLKADTPEEIAACIDALFSDNIKIQNQINIQNQYLNDTTWEKVALQFVSFFNN